MIRARDLIQRYPVVAAQELVRMSQDGEPVAFPEMWVVWFYIHGTARSRRIVSHHLYDILNGDLRALDRVVRELTHNHRGWGRSVRRGVAMFLQRIPRAVRAAQADDVIDEFTIRELASLSHMKGRGAW